jgi:pyrroloquinoline quinone biosynthesis protein B
MRLRGETTDPKRGDVIALALRATEGKSSVLYAPGVAAIGEELEAEAARAEVLLVDGTCFTNEETQGLAGRTSADMGHVTIDGPGGSLAWLETHAHARRIYVHINNTNPILAPASAPRRRVEAAGVEVGQDGIELTVG